MTEKHKERVKKLQQALRDLGYDAFFASTPITMEYLVGHREGGGERMMLLGIAPDHEPAILIPALALVQAKATTGIQDITTWMDGEDPGVKFAAWAERWGLRTGVIAVDDEMTSFFLLRMQQALPAALFKPGTPVMEACRGRKDAEEIAFLQYAASAVDEAYEAGLAAIRVGATEMDVARAISDATNAQGLITSFGIVGAGPHGAMPHYHTGHKQLEPGDVIVMDFGGTYHGYFADITRTACLGEASEEAKKVYRIVRDAHYAAREVAKPGVAAQEVDRAARRVIADAGYGEYFVHRVGHGIGLQCHEPPYMVEGNETLLAEGHTFTVEPGIYLPDRFGVRLENVVVITSDGCRSLNAEPAPELLEIPTG